MKKIKVTKRGKLAPDVLLTRTTLQLTSSHIFWKCLPSSDSKQMHYINTKLYKSTKAYSRGYTFFYMLNPTEHVTIVGILV